MKSDFATVKLDSLLIESPHKTQNSPPIKHRIFQILRNYINRQAIFKISFL